MASNSFLFRTPRLFALLIALVSGRCIAQLAPASPEANADFAARATASTAVLYATNFDDVYLDGARNATRSGIVTDADLANEAQEIPPNPENLKIDKTIRISGANSCRIVTLGSRGSSSGGYFAFRPDGRTAAQRTKLYVQLSIYFPSETIGYRFDHNGDSYFKAVNFGQYGAGQVVIGDNYFSGFPVLLLNGTNTLGGYLHAVSSSDNPWGAATTIENPAIDKGAALTANSSKEQWLNNFGPMPRTMARDGDYNYNSAEPYLYQRANMPYGWADSRASASGAVPWQRDAWTTLEAHLEYNGTGNVSTIQVWVARYGQPPVLIVNEVGTVNLGSAGTNAWSRFELLNYATGRKPDATRPTQNTYYGEVIVSTEPIRFPGQYPIAAVRPSPVTNLQAH